MSQTADLSHGGSFPRWIPSWRIPSHVGFLRRIPSRRIPLTVDPSWRIPSRRIPLTVDPSHGGSPHGGSYSPVDPIHGGSLSCHSGRIQDLAQRGALSLSDIRFATLDEADQMLDMGFADDMAEILALCTNTSRQTCLFSATLPK